MEKYDIETKKAVGRGAFGNVYLYQRKDDKKEIIIKQVAIDDLSTDERKGVFNEIRLQQRLDHPNIIRYHEYFIHDNSFMIVMEYAPGGNLYDYLQAKSEKDTYLEEEEVLKFFAQISRAMHYIHKDNILHRDMKTHNLLLDRKKKVVKICDFGISKLLTKTNAVTTVGTPHYMSPEVVEGKAYNKKSDVWSLGCILYELITLKRTFEAASVSNVLLKITKCEYSPMPERYSQDLRNLVKDILQRDPADRPTVQEILATPVLINALFDLETDIGRIPCLYGYGKKRTKDPYASKSTSFTHGHVSSEHVSFVYYWGGGVTQPVMLNLPPTDPYVTQVCAGRSKKMGVTSNGSAILWESSFSTTVGTLSQFSDENESSVTSATKLLMKAEIVGNISGFIKDISCGDFFTAVCDKKGILMTWGSGEHGCLGHDSVKDKTKPTVVEALVGYTVTKISCGAFHCMTLTKDGIVFVWGKGSSGNLGLGDRQDRLKPTPVSLPPHIIPVSVKCGTNYSFIISKDGSVYACGNNRDNKLALLTDQELKSKTKESLEYLDFKKVTCHPVCDYKIVDIATGPNHTALLADSGVVITCGSNKNNQLGYLKGKDVLRPAIVDALKDKYVKFIGCGDTFTTAVTADNCIFTWGGGKKGRLGYEVAEDVITPKEVFIEHDKAKNFKFHSLSVCHNSTLISGKVSNAS